MYEKHSILTSARIQRQYFDVVKRREEIPAKKEYLLISVDKIKGLAYENAVSVCRNQKNVCRTDTSKVKESKVKEKTESVRRFEDFLSVYPKSCNRHLTEIAYINLVVDNVESEDNLIQCAKNYAEACSIEETPERYIKNAENFLKEFAFEKYLPEKYKKPKPAQKKSNNSFNDFEQNNYDFEELEREILGNG